MSFVHQDWPAIIKRIAGRGIPVAQRIGVSRMTVWRWQEGVSTPSGDHAAALLILDETRKLADVIAHQQHP